MMVLVISEISPVHAGGGTRGAQFFSFFFITLEPRVE
jgi:hypothetical protein